MFPLPRSCPDRRGATQRSPVARAQGIACERIDFAPARRKDSRVSNSAPFRPDQPAQDEVREWFLGLGSEPWLPLLKIARHGRSHVGVLCALAPRSYRSKAV